MSNKHTNLEKRLSQLRVTNEQYQYLQREADKYGCTVMGVLRIMIAEKMRGSHKEG